MGTVVVPWCSGPGCSKCRDRGLCISKSRSGQPNGMFRWAGGRRARGDLVLVTGLRLLLWLRDPRPDVPGRTVRAAALVVARPPWPLAEGAYVDRNLHVRPTWPLARAARADDVPTVERELSRQNDGYPNSAVRRYR